ncbi:hypothetical protein [Umboniibacter marinipuniceus]|uniref:hypothetical protein n=1 Tax=Umboniibacter marinipuniceus TaxID=569599 RepID=UPI0011C48B39|nr:hypothetical protein [Umboniibacter marinipuniceus]
MAVPNASATDLSGEAINDFNRSVCLSVCMYVCIYVCITSEGYQYPEITEAKSTKIKFHYRLDEVE